MAYADQTRRPSPVSMIAVVAVHAAIGTALITGLSFTGVLTPPPKPLKLLRKNSSSPSAEEEAINSRGQQQATSEAVRESLRKNSSSPPAKARKGEDDK